MAELTLRIHDPSGTRTRDVRVQPRDGSTVGELIDALLELFAWPSQTMDGEPIDYALRRLGAEAVIPHDTTLASLDLLHGNALVLGPNAIPVEAR